MDSTTSTFELNRPLLFSIAYRMLSSVMEAEDILQEAYLRFRRASAQGEVQHARAYLCAIVTRLCLDHLKSATTQREQYIGEWLPEPLHTGATPEQIIGDAETLSMAFLLLLESLNPTERAVFLLREVFDYDYSEIAAYVDKSESTCRQIFSRAKKHITANRPRFTPTPQEQSRILGAFMLACQNGDLAALKSVLTADVTAISDGGGKVSAALRPLHGTETVAQFVLGLFKRAPAGVQYELCTLNNALSFVVRNAQNAVEVAIVPEFNAAGQICALRFVRNPDKLRAL